MQSQISASGWIHGIVGRSISSVSLHIVTNESRDTIIWNKSKGTLILGGQLSKHRSLDIAGGLYLYSMSLFHNHLMRGLSVAVCLLGVCCLCSQSVLFLR